MADGGGREFRALTATGDQVVVADELEHQLTTVTSQKEMRNVVFYEVRDVVLTAMGLGNEDIVLIRQIIIADLNISSVGLTHTKPADVRHISILTHL